ncbi:hypothetical protein D3C80_1739160 [compost metagenome]
MQVAAARRHDGFAVVLAACLPQVHACIAWAGQAEFQQPAQVLAVPGHQRQSLRPGFAADLQGVGQVGQVQAPMGTADKGQQLLRRHPAFVFGLGRQHH